MSMVGVTIKSIPLIVRRSRKQEAVSHEVSCPAILNVYDMSTRGQGPELRSVDMTDLSAKLAQLEAAGSPIQVGLIGAGKFGSML